MTMNNDLTVPEFTSIASTVMAPQQQQQQHVSSTPRNFASTVLPPSFPGRNRSRSVRRVLRELGHNDARANDEMFARHMSDLETISRKKFIENYNFDPVLMQPTDGPDNRYEWERQTPPTYKEQQVKTLCSLPKNSRSQMKQQLSERPASVDTETADTASQELQSRLQPAETTVTSTNDEATTGDNQSSKRAADNTSDSSSKGCLEEKSISSTTTTAAKDSENTENKVELEGKGEQKEELEKLPSDLPKVTAVVAAATVVTSTLTTARLNSGAGTGSRQTRITDFTRHCKRIHSSSSVKQDQDGGSMQSPKRQRLH